MINNNINFIGERTQKRVILTKQIRLVTFGMTLVLIVLLIVYSIVLVLHISPKAVSSQLDKTVVLKENEINALKQTESSIYTVSSRAKIIKDLGLDNRSQVFKTLDLVDKLADKNFIPKGDVKFGSVDSFKVDGEVNTVGELTGINTIFDELKTQGYIDDYRVESVQRRPDGGYQLLVNLDITKKL